MNRRAKPKHASALPKTELDRMAEEFDREFVADTFGPPPPAVRARLDRAKRKRGRPRLGAGSQAISVTIEKTLLKRIDALAKRTNTPRARLIARGLQAVLGEQMSGARGSNGRRRSRLAAAR
jgi:hypothetical protein